jgi:phosphohistidine phosphatase
MIRQLVVMRHAKSSWKDASLVDHDRPLNKRGKRDAPRVAERLEALGWIPERVISSDSKRTRQTWKRMARAIDGDVEVEYRRSFYHGNLTVVREALARLPDGIQCVMVLGHNPHWEDLVAWLSGEPTRLTTANAALLVGDGGTWSELLAHPGKWRLEQVIRPKEL